MQIIIPLKVDSNWSANKIYAGTHWTVRKKQADQVHEMVMWLTRGKEQFNAPVDITIEFNCRLDIDNCSYPAKLIIDGLRHSGVLIDDTKKYIKSLSLRFWDGDGIRVTISEVV